MKSALEKILENKVVNGRVTSQSQKEQWTCLQKIIAINKLIVDYHNAFIELKDSYTDLLDRYNVINAEWTTLKADMEDIANQWTEFKPLVQQIISLWENTVSPTFEEWQTLMENWGNTMNGYSSTMQDYEQQMMNIQQQFNTIETEWGKITLAVKGEYEIENINATAALSKMFSTDDYNDVIIIPTSGTCNCAIRMNTTAVTNIETLDTVTAKSFAYKYCGNSGLNSVFEWHGVAQMGTMWTDPTEKQIGFFIQPNTTPCELMIFKRKVPYFSADQSSQIEQAVETANEAITKCNSIESKLKGEVLLDFTGTPISGNNTFTFTTVKKSEWNNLTVIISAGDSSHFTPFTIPIKAIESTTTPTRIFTSSDDVYGGFKAYFVNNDNYLVLQNVSTSSSNSIRFVSVS